MALHNIPEGIAIAVILFSRGFSSPLLFPSFFEPFSFQNLNRMSMTVVTTWVTMSHMPQPVFAVIAYLYLGTQYTKTMLPLGFVQGCNITITISIIILLLLVLLVL